MAEEQEEKAMSFKLKDLPTDKEFKLKLDCATAVRSGEGKFGNWYLWFGYVENAPKVVDRDKKTEIKDYTGKVSFFPNGKINTELEGLANGNNNVEVSIVKSLEETEKAIYRKYAITKLSEGTPPSGASVPSLTPGELKLIQDVESMISSGYSSSITEAVFIKASTEPKYGGQIDEERAKQLFLKLFNK